MLWLSRYGDMVWFPVTFAMMSTSSHPSACTARRWLAQCQHCVSSTARAAPHRRMPHLARLHLPPQRLLDGRHGLVLAHGHAVHAQRDVADAVYEQHSAEHVCHGWRLRVGGVWREGQQLDGPRGHLGRLDALLEVLLEGRLEIAWPARGAAVMRLLTEHAISSIRALEPSCPALEPCIARCTAAAHCHNSGKAGGRPQSSDPHVST